MSISHFHRRVTVPVPASELYQWHARPGAFERLTPPWQPVQVESVTGPPGATSPIADGTQVVLRVAVAGPIAIRWALEHQDNVPGRQFADVQTAGPFASWRHLHRIEASPADADTSTLHDEIAWALPFGPLGRLAAGWHVRRTLNRLFDHRHAVTTADLERHAAVADRGGPPLRIAVTGASGLIGRALAPFLTTGGHTVLRLVRHAATAPDEVHWDPATGAIDSAALEGVDAVIHLAGEPVAERWTAAHKRAIRDSRVNGTRLLATALAGLSRKPSVLLSTSAVGFYGDGGDRELDETSEAGNGFLPDVAQEWEAAADPARAAGIRVVHPRLGVVLSEAGGALAKLLPPFRLGAGGRVGSGEQYMSWIALDDVVGALHWLLFAGDVSGAVNVVAPAPVTNAGFGTALGHVLHRPALAVVPGFVVKALFGEMAEEMLLTGQRVLPRRLLDGGFRFRHPTVELALRFELGRAE